ncbi:hypothetical protein ACQ4PT_030942 [Festuca glaucescens]
MVRKNVKETTGKGWFDMPAPSIAPELKKDIEILQDLGEAFSLCTFGQNVGYIVKRASRKMEVLPRCFIRMVRFNWDFSCNNLSGRSTSFLQLAAGGQSPFLLLITPRFFISDLCFSSLISYFKILEGNAFGL